MAKLKNEVSLDSDSGSVSSGGGTVPANSKSKKTPWVLLALALVVFGVIWVAQQDESVAVEGEVTVEEVVEDAAEAVDETADVVGEVTEETSEEVK